MIRFLLIFFFFLISFGNLPAIQYENLQIEQMEIIGNVPEGCFFDPKLVQSHMKTREGDTFSQNVFDNDLKTLASEYDRIEPCIELVNQKIKLTLKVWPKPMIRSIQWEGNCGITTKELKKELDICICTVFDKIGFNKAFHKIKAYYIKKGYFEAELNYNVQFDALTNEVDIVICVNEGRSGWISRIYFHNFCPDEEDEIAEMMVTKKYIAFTSWMTSEGLYNEDAINYDQTQIVNYLQNLGYADATVKIEAIDSPTFLERIHLHITANKGELYQIGAITFEGNELFSNEEIEDLFLICEGDNFSPDLIRETGERIEMLYGRKGYIDASIDFETKLELDCGNVYSVHYTIEESEMFRVGMVKVFGNCTTQTNVILHESLLTPGEVFNTIKLELTEARLRNIGYFSNVNVYAVRTDAGSCLQGNYRDVHIEVEEQQTGRFGTFFGYSTAESLFAGINITEKNFNSAGLSSIFCDDGGCLRGGGEFLSLTLSVGQKSRNCGLSWTKPYFMDTKWSVGFDIEKTSTGYISDDYDIKALSYRLRGNYEYNAFTRLGLHYRISNTHVNLEHGARSFWEDPELWRASRIHGLISAVGFALSYDSTNRIDLPTRGLRSTFEAEFAGVGGDHTFLSFAYLNSYYYSLCEKGVLKFRADLRFIQPLWKTGFNDIPMDERLYLSGDNVARGYRQYKLGPVFERSGDPKGGISLQILSMEYNHNFAKRVNGFLFLDGGSLSEHKWRFDRMYWSAGFGARVCVMDSFPPITLGVGFPFNPKTHYSKCHRHDLKIESVNRSNKNKEKACKEKNEEFIPNPHHICNPHRKRHQVKNFFMSFGGSF